MNNPVLSKNKSCIDSDAPSRFSQCASIVIEIQDQNADAESSKKHKDAFLYFSDDERRLSILKNGVEPPSAGRQNLTRQEQQQCKTRISFKLHPLLIMEDLLDNIMHEDDVCGLGAIEFALMGDAKAALFAELLQ